MSETSNVKGTPAVAVQRRVRRRLGLEICAVCGIILDVFLIIMVSMWHAEIGGSTFLIICFSLQAIAWLVILVTAWRMESPNIPS